MIKKNMCCRQVAIAKMVQFLGARRASLRDAVWNTSQTQTSYKSDNLIHRHAGRDQTWTGTASLDLGEAAHCTAPEAATLAP